MSKAVSKFKVVTMKINEETKSAVLSGVFAFSIISFVAGLINGSSNDCEYKSIASRITIPYVLGCELNKPRFKVKGKCETKTINHIVDNDAYQKGYHLVYFLDGTSKVIMVDKGMIGDKIKICNK